MPNWKKLIVSGSDANLNSLDITANSTIGGLLKVADGSNSAPSITFTDDTDTGIYRSTDNAFNITVGGVNKFTVNSAGITSGGNVYSGNSSEFRNYGGTWKATTGLTGNGFQFINSVDGTALTLDSTGSATFGAGVIIDSVSSHGRISAGSSFFIGGGNTTLVQLSSKLIPDADSTRDLGASNRYWKDAYIDTITTTGTIDIGGDISGSDVHIDDWGSVSASLSTLTQNQIDGSGTANYVARFSDPNTLTTGLIQDDGSSVGINAGPSSKTLYVNGTGQFTGELFVSHLDIMGSNASRLRDDVVLRFGTNRRFGLRYNSSDDKLQFISSSNSIIDIEGTGNTTFAGDIAVGPKNNATITVSESGGATTKLMGASVGRVGTYSNHNFEIVQNSSAAITIDTSKNATFAGNITVSGGTLNLGNDVSLFDDGTNILRTDDTLHANNSIHVGGDGKIYDRANTSNFIELADTVNISTDTSVTGDLTVTGNITAQEFHTELVSASIVYESGSTKFGNTYDDTHDFTGSINVQGDGIAGNFRSNQSTGLKVRGGANNQDIAQFLNSSGTTIAVIDTSGNVGIGSTDPSVALDVYAAGAAAKIKSLQTTALQVIGGGNGSDIVEFKNTAGTTKAYFDTNGKLGIGTSALTGNFNSYISATRQLTHNGNGGDFSILSDNNNTPIFYVKGTGTADLVNIFDNTTEVFTILDGGNVGVGTTTPIRTFHVEKATTYPGRFSYNSTNYLDIGYDSLNVKGGSLLFRNDGTEHLRINTTGALKAALYGSGNFTGTLAYSLGVDSSGNIIEFSGGSGGSVSSITNGADNRIATFTGADSLNGEANLTFDGDIFAVNTDELYVSASRVGIGTTSPAVTLHVDGFARLNGGLQLNQNGAAQVYQIQNNPLRFGTNNTERMRIMAAGQVGIGTTSAFTTGGTADLSVAGSRIAFGASNNDMAYFRRLSTGNFQWQTYNSGNTGNIHLQPYGGNVGIGTTSPDTSLELFKEQDGDYLGLKISKLHSNGYEYTTEYGNNQLKFSGNQNYNLYNDSNKVADFHNAHTKIYGNGGILKMNISGSGEVVIGALSSGATGQLIVNQEGGVDPVAKFMSRTNKAIVQISDNDTTGYLSSENGLLSLGRHAGVNAANININASHNVGIGTSTPGAKLDVHGRVDFANDLRLRGTDSAADQGVVRFFVDSNNKLFIDTANDGNNRFVIDSSGNVGIGSLTPARKLDVDGEIQNNGIFRKGGNVIIKSTGSETMFGPGGSGIITFHNSATMTTGDETMRIDANGNLLLNNTSAGARLDIREDSNYAIRAEDASGHYFRVNTGGDVDMRGDLTVQGIITAQEFHTEFVSASIIHESGSSQFGNSADDNHIFTGSIKVTNLQTNGETLFEAQRHPNFYFKIQDYAQVDHKVNGAVNAFTIRNTATSQAAPVLRLGHGTAGSPHISTYSTNEDLTIDPNGTGKTRIKGSADVTGSLDVTGSVHLSDSSTLKIGDASGGDLQLYHNGAHSLISNQSGNLYIRNQTNDGKVYFQADDGNGNDTNYFYLDGTRSDGTNFATRFPDQSIILLGSGTGWNDGSQIYHNGTNSFWNEYVGNLNFTVHTDDGDIIFNSDDGSGGVAQYFRVDGGIHETVFSKSTRHMDNVQAKFGSGEDLKIYHDGSNSYIQDAGTGNLWIQGSSQVNIGGANGEIGIQYVENANVTLRHNNSAKLTTTSTGVTVTGDIDADDITIDDWGSVSASLSSIQQAGGVNGSGQADRVAIWSDADTVTFDSGFQYHSDSLKLYNADYTAIDIQSDVAEHSSILFSSGSTSSGRIGWHKQGYFATSAMSVNPSNAMFINSNHGFDFTHANTGSLSIASGSANVIVDSKVKLGVGTATPSSKLDVNGTGTFRGNVDIYKSNAKLTIQSTGASEQASVDLKNGSLHSRLILDSDDLLRVYNQTSAFDAFAIKSSGNVGIGHASPNSRLDIRQSGDGIGLEIHNTGGNTDDYIDIKMIAGNTNSGTLGTILRHERQGSSGGDFAILTNPTLTGTPVERFRISKDGPATFQSNVTLYGSLTVGDSNADTAQISLKHLLGYCENTDVDTGTETIKELALATYQAVFFDYVVKNGTNLRAGTVTAVHDGTNVEFTDTSTKDLGDTSAVTLSVDISGTNMRLLATTTSDNWIVKANIRGIKV